MMASVQVAITKEIDDHVPGWVECELIDIDGKLHVFREKTPIVDSGEGEAGADYPRLGAIRCTVIEIGSETAIIDTEFPDGVESISGQTRFSVSPKRVQFT